MKNRIFVLILIAAVLGASALGGCSWMGRTAGKTKAKVERKVDSLEQGYEDGYDQEKGKTQ
ncbi:hypothetical protein LJC48_02305 [Desulfovibrio sp. OttesenSCG-928-C06]|nr:hypothetical protein [Desulfovibrio sp. OttesenSCG-928-C06]